MDKPVHILPTEDFMPHVPFGLTCWCKPTMAERLIYHNPMDEREKIETGEAKVQ